MGAAESYCMLSLAAANASEKINYVRNLPECYASEIQQPNSVFPCITNLCLEQCPLRAGVNCVHLKLRSIGATSSIFFQ